MQLISPNLIVLNPGDPYAEVYNDHLKIYLSGSLDLGCKLPWQQKFINGIIALTTPHPEKPELPDYSRFKFLVINPLSPSSNPEPSLENPEFTEKMGWELQMQGMSDVIFCNFLKKSTVLSGLQGFMLWAQSGKVISRCPSDYLYYPQVKMISQAFNVPVLGDSDSMLQVLEVMFQSIPKFNELLNFNLQ